MLQIDQPSQRLHMFDARKHSSNTVRAHFQHSETKGLQIIETVYCLAVIILMSLKVDQEEEKLSTNLSNETPLFKGMKIE